MSSTLFFGSHGAYKQVRCAQLAGILAWLALWAGDQVGGIVFSGQDILVRRPARRKKSVLQLLDALARFQHTPEAGPALPDASGQHTLDVALQEARRVAHTGSRIFVLSDFLNVTDDTSGLLGALARHNTVSVLRIVDPLEQKLPDSGRFAVAGPDGPVWFNGSDRRFQQAFAQKVAIHEQAIARCFRTAGVADQVINTRDDPAQSLRLILGPRGRIG